MKSWERHLQKIYYDPSHPASFEGENNLYNLLRKEKKFKLTHEQIKSWLRKQNVYTLNKAVKRNFQRGRVIVSGIDDQWDIDLASFDKEHKDNDGYKHVLVAIDILSHFTWIEPIKNKSATSIVAAFEKILKKGRKPRRLRSDAGTDFTSNVFQKFCVKKKIVHFTTHNEKQANYVERVIKTIKSKVYKYIIANNHERYVDILQDIVSAYNNRWHKTIKTEPINVTKKNENKIWWQMYWPKKSIKDVKKEKILHLRKRKRKRNKLKFQIDDQVRISATRSTLIREYHTKWSGEVFTISERFIRQNQPLYRIKDWSGEKVKGTFYTYELQHVNIDENDLFLIDEIIKYRGSGKQKEAKIHWKGWPKKFDSWIKASEIKEHS